CRRARARGGQASARKHGRVVRASTRGPVRALPADRSALWRGPRAVPFGLRPRIAATNRHGLALVEPQGLRPDEGQEDPRSATRSLAGWPDRPAPERAGALLALVDRAPV